VLRVFLLLADLQVDPLNADWYVDRDIQCGHRRVHSLPAENLKSVVQIGIRWKLPDHFQLDWHTERKALHSGHQA
jgi:hypothetical protein